ncbi:hypothetical protein GWK47_037249 [Chionoecetes opilio]|uniref:Uncharacterized protein n=1 Tax=Chionoecetes opilio TaxID=41210 RepID=A0A8J4YSP5_CHIOP|nr:hypothetical protein GWK47_037249 [Chionoecetes opilio]
MRNRVVLLTRWYGTLSTPWSAACRENVVGSARGQDPVSCCCHSFVIFQPFRTRKQSAADALRREKRVVSGRRSDESAHSAVATLPVTNSIISPSLQSLCNFLLLPLSLKQPTLSS